MCRDPTWTRIESIYFIVWIAVLGIASRMWGLDSSLVGLEVQKWYSWTGLVRGNSGPARAECAIGALAARVGVLKIFRDSW
jgi:hypothetical protein